MTATGVAIRCLALLAALLPALPSAADEPRLALVVGNGAYADGALANPVNDARDIAARLQSLGFEVELLLDADQRTMEQAIHTFTNRLAGGGKVGLFYFAGHGIEHDGRNFLIPIGAAIRGEVDLRYEAVDAGRVLDGMSAAGNGLNLVVLDACRNNPYGSAFRSASRGLARASPAKGTLVLYATQPGAVARDGDGRNGVFTRHLLGAMEEPGLEVEQVFKRAALGVDGETGGEQTPWVEGVVLGRFMFLPPGGVPAPAAAMAQSAAEPAPPPALAPIAPVPVPRPPEPIQVQVGHLQVNVNAQAQVHLDGSWAGEAAPGRPLNLSNLALGEHRVTVSAAGFAAQERTARVEPGRWTQELVSLVPERPPEPARVPAPRTLEQIGDGYPGPYNGVSSASFRCVGSLKPVERTICNDPGLARADGVMGAIYRDLRSILGGTDADTLRAAQRAWIKRRDRLCPGTDANCLRRATDERIGELWALLQSVSGR